VVFRPTGIYFLHTPHPFYLDGQNASTYIRSCPAKN
jgi:hypothetical protein